jgi:hypothetical protein
MKKYILHSAIIGFALIIISFLLIFVAIKPSIFPGLDLSKTGDIGDTIGGITAPFLNIFGSLLIYVSFREQYKANQIQQKAILDELKSTSQEKEFQLIDSVLTDFKHSYDKLTFATIEPRKISHQNQERILEEVFNTSIIALTKFPRYFGVGSGIFSRQFEEKGFIIQLMYCLQTFNYAVRRINTINKSQSDFNYFIEKVHTLYDTLLRHQVDDILEIFENNTTEKTITFKTENKKTLDVIANIHSEIKLKLFN